RGHLGQQHCIADLVGVLAHNGHAATEDAGIGEDRAQAGHARAEVGVGIEVAAADHKSAAIATGPAQAFGGVPHDHAARFAHGELQLVDVHATAAVTG